ncbi:MAG: sulfatase-like hydrolase/transferase [Anaerolineae bacterium]|nr:sulfatase-like hydrolase/transferase [Anaerolineae bacterium]
MAASERLNILLIVNDQHRYDTLGCYGAPICRTPHIDALAARGVRFDAAYTPTSPCSPARAALFTGLYPHKNHVLYNGLVLNPEVPNLASELQKASYNLGYAGKWHVDRAHVPSEYGFEGKDFPGYGYPPGGGVIEGLRFGGARREPIPHYPEYLKAHGYEPPKVLEAFYGDNAGKLNQEMYALQSGSLETTFEYMVSEFAIELLRKFQGDYEREGKPFFLCVNFWGPHTPCLLPEEYYYMYPPEDIPEEPSFTETWDRKPRVQELYERFWGLSSGGWRSWREIIARYWGYVTMLDHLAGRIIDELEALGLAKNTVVIFTTDHGDMMGAHRLIEKGPFMYEQCYRLPLVIAHPACEAPGSVCEEFVYLHDLYPTFLEIAGLEPPAVPDSQSILENILGRPTPTGRESVYSVFHRQIFSFEQRMVRTRRYKFVFNASDFGELYDLQNDPWEMRNIADLPETKEIQEELMEMMRAHMVRLGDPLLREFDRIRYVY